MPNYVIEIGNSRKYILAKFIEIIHLRNLIPAKIYSISVTNFFVMGFYHYLWCSHTLGDPAKFFLPLGIVSILNNVTILYLRLG